MSKKKSTIEVVFNLLQTKPLGLTSAEIKANHNINKSHSDKDIEQAVRILANTPSVFKNEHLMRNKRVVYYFYKYAKFHTYEASQAIDFLRPKSKPVTASQVGSYFWPTAPLGAATAKAVSVLEILTKAGIVKKSGVPVKKGGKGVLWSL